MKNKDKISVIGTGKTGSSVVELLGNELLYAFDAENPPELSKLKESDALIIFVPGDAAEDILDIVVNSGTPAAWGTTGYTWPENLGERVRAAESRWVLATNFSLGMNLVRKAIQTLSAGAEALDNPEFSIHEIHHVNKKDAPSGTALSWNEWLGKEAEISSERTGDVKGIHELTIQTGREEIRLRHEAKDRSLFAEGAIWAARQLIHNKEIENGVHDFSVLFDKVMRES